MTTIVERDSNAGVGLALALFVLLLAGGLWIAYKNGVFQGKTTTIENTRTIENRTVETPSAGDTSTGTSTDSTSGSSASKQP